MDISVAKEKILKYCSYQERSQKEVKDKLYKMELYTNQVNELLVFLIQENYLNEERFALHFAGSKMRQKKWGKRKISNELWKKGISDKLIQKSLDELNLKQYVSNLQLVIEKKDRTLKYSSAYERKQKLIRYLMGRGYAWSEIEPNVATFLSEN